MKWGFFKHCFYLLAIFALVLPKLSLSDALAGAEISEALSKLNAVSMQDRSAAIDQLAIVKDPRAIVILQALLDGHLYTLKAENKLVIGTDTDAGYQFSDALSGNKADGVERDATQKITLNNSLRISLRKTIGRLELNASEPRVRINAVHAIAKAIDEDSLALLREHLIAEKDVDVQDEIKLVLGLEDLKSEDKAARVAAIDLLKNHANQEVVNQLNALVEKDA